MGDAPDSLIWIVTGRCNLRCPYCYATLYERDRELGADAIARVLKEAADAGVEWVQFTGGEPLLRRDVLRIVETAVDLGMTTSLFSNLTLMGRDEAERLAGLGVKVYTSLDGPKEVYEAAKGQGSWEKFTRGLQAVREAGARLHINIPLSKHNYRLAGEALRLALELGAETVSAIPAMRAGRARETGHYISAGELLEALRLLEEAAEEAGVDVAVWCTPFIALLPWARRLHSGNYRNWKVLDVAPNGDVLLCDVTGIRVANVLIHGVLGAWERLRSHPLARATMRLPEACRGCPAAPRCWGGCYARALAEGMELPAPDPLCPRMAGLKYS